MDWNNDGKLDILSGCYWSDGKDGGFIHVLAGKGKLNFAEAIFVENAEGDPLQNVALSKDGSGSGMAENQTEVICTQQHAVDYDGDGDLDMVVGCFANSFYYYENFGTSEETALSAEPVKLPISSPGYHSAPHLTDWDSDGDLDLLSGTSQGGVILSENTGTREKPNWTAFKQLVSGSASRTQTADNVSPSASTRVWATDWNNDGKMDLLVGDCVTLKDESNKRTGHVWVYVRK